MWTIGIINGFEFQVKHYEKGSEFGINGGKISKLHISKDGNVYASYERGWSKKPTTRAAKAVFNELINRFN